jgi:hypothetical protein
MERWFSNYCVVINHTAIADQRVVVKDDVVTDPAVRSHRDILTDNAEVSE